MVKDFLLATGIVLALFLLAALLSTQTVQVSSGELLGEYETYPMYTFRLSNITTVGVLVHPHANYLLLRFRDDCTLRQISGGEVYALPPVVPCKIRWSDGLVRFRGWLEWRGNQRKFCGAVEGYDLPEQCNLGY